MYINENEFLNINIDTCYYVIQILHICIYIYIYIYIYINCLCGSVTKALDTQAVGHGFEPRPDH